MPATADRNPPGAPSRLVRQSTAADIVGVKRQYVPVLIAQGELEIEEHDGLTLITRASAERCRDKRIQRQAEEAKSPAA